MTNLNCSCLECSRQLNGFVVNSAFSQKFVLDIYFNVFLLFSSTAGLEPAELIVYTVSSKMRLA